MLGKLKSHAGDTEVTLRLPAAEQLHADCWRDKGQKGNVRAMAPSRRGGHTWLPRHCQSCPLPEQRKEGSPLPAAPLSASASLWMNLIILWLAKGPWACSSHELHRAEQEKREESIWKQRRQMPAWSSRSWEDKEGREWEAARPRQKTQLLPFCL